MYLIGRQIFKRTNCSFERTLESLISKKYNFINFFSNGLAVLNRIVLVDLTNQEVTISLNTSSLEERCP